MEQLTNIPFSEIVSTIAGLGLIGYACFQGFKKACGDMDWYKERQAKKRAAKKEEEYEVWKEFQKRMKTENKETEKEELKELYDEFTENFVEKYADKIVDEIHKTDEAQNEKIDKLITSSNDMLRKELVTMYYHYLPYKKITIYMKKSFMKLYQDYHEQGGNSFIDEIYRQVITWDVVDTEEEAVREVKN